MHGKMAVFYAISRGADGTWIPTMLPMGSTWGPALGQTTTVAMIAYREGPTDPDLGLRVPSGCIPAILYIVDKDEAVIGYILICIDNVAVVCKDQAVTNAWFARLNRNAKALGIFPFKKEDRTHWTDAHFEFIGLQYEHGRWRHCPDRILKWAKRYGTTEGDGTLRNLDEEVLQSVVGVLVWDKRLRIEDMTGMREVFGIQRRALSQNNPTPPTTHEIAAIQEKWATLLRNDFQEWSESTWPPKHAGRPTTVLVTDASEPRWSWLEMRDGEVTRDAKGTVHNPNDVFPAVPDNETPKADTTVAALAIYYKELFTVLLAFRALAKEGRTNVDITLVGDSQAVIGSIRRKMGPEPAWWMLDEIIDLVTANGWGLVLKWVESDGNVAHSATHVETITAYRTARSWLVSQSDDYPPAVGGNAKRDREGKII